MDTAESLFPSIELSVREGQKLQFGTGLASKKRTPIQAAMMSFSFCLFSKATGEI